MTTTAFAPVARARILCVDDDEDTREMMGVLLTEFGYDAVIAASVSDALESARSGGLALCILDHWLMEGNGIDLCQQIRAFDSQTPIMFYSGAAYKADIQKGLDAGAQVYLVKPDIENLKPTIDRLIREATPKTAVVNPFAAGCRISTLSDSDIPLTPRPTTNLADRSVRRAFPPALNACP